MEYSFKATVAEACRTLLRPIVTTLLKCGMSWKEFSELSKSVYVEMATGKFGIRGRPTNVSRVSILTGISRKEIKRQRDLLAANRPAATTTKATGARRLLSGWYQDSDYLDEQGAPLELPETGPAPSFETLYETHGGDVPTVAMLKELIKTGAVAKSDNGLFKPLSRYYQPVRMDPELITAVFGMSLRDLADTLENNVAGDTKTVPRFQGYADDREIDPRHLPAFREMLDKRGQQFLEEVDAWLAEHRVSNTNEPGETLRLGVGVYAIDGPHQPNVKGTVS